jgi:small subunit ribosomal protein S8
MAIHDSIGDMLTIIRNCARAGNGETTVRKSKLTLSILAILKKERYIFDYKIPEGGDPKAGIRVYIDVPAKVKSAPLRKITRIERVSRPGLRIYKPYASMPKILNGIGMCVVSTPEGVMTGADAKRNRVGGEVLLKVW